MAKIDKTKLGVDASHFDRASVEFLRADSPMVEAINARIMEGLNSNFKVIKDDNGHNRPFLVVEYPELHASVAMYMTSSIDETRMEIDNNIRGEHLFKSPFGLFNYISRSSIRGKLESGKMSVIDRNRFLFITADSFVSSQSKAVNIDDFKVGIYTHLSNAQNISELLSLDLAGRNFMQSVLSGQPELWVYKRTERQPIMFNPSAMYLSLAINAFERFDNKKLNIKPDRLLEMGELAGDTTYAYSEYLRYNDRVLELERKDAQVYNIFEAVRYYASLTPATFNKIIENKELADETGSNKYRYIYGDPVYEPSKPIEKRISMEINRAIQQGNLTGKRDKKKIAEQILELIKAERQVSQTLGSASEAVIKFLDKVSEDERINLSYFVYSQNFWKEFYENYADDNYVGSIMDDFNRKYQSMATHYERRQLDKKRADEQKKLAEKMQVVQLTQAEKERQERIKELKKRLENHYMELYAPAVKEYMAGKLLPCAETVKTAVEDLCEPTQVNTTEFTIGKKLADRLLTEMKSTLVLSEQLKVRGAMVVEAEKKIKTLSKSDENTSMLDLVSKIALAEQKYTRTSQTKLDKQSRKKIISEVVDSLSESELSMYIEPKYDYGKQQEEILARIQDVYMNRNVINSFVNLKSRKMDIINALVELNDPTTLLGYHLTYEAVSEMHKGGAVLPNGGKLQSMEEFVAEYDALADALTTRKNQPVAYKGIKEGIEQKITTMKNFTTDAQELMQARQSYFELLKSYEKQRTKLSARLYGIMRREVDARQKQTIDELTNLESAGFEEIEDGVWVERAGVDEEETWRGKKEEAEEFLEHLRETLEPCMEWENYVDLHEDQDVVQELCAVCYPSKDDLMKATRSKLAQTTSIKEALKIYKSAKATILHLNDDMDEFAEMVAGEYGLIVYQSEDILENLSKWRYWFEMLGDNLYEKRRNAKDVEEPWRRLVAEAYRETAKTESARAGEDYIRFRKALRERTRKIIAGYSPRVDEVQSLMYFLSKSTVKSQTYEHGVMMPKSIMGDTDGLVISLDKIVKIKREATTMFGVSAGFDGECHSDRDVYEGYKVSELKANRKAIMKLITDGMDIRMKQLQKQELEQEKKAMIETTRHFGTLGESERELIFDTENGLEMYLKGLIEKYGDKGGRVASSLSYSFVNKSKKNKDEGTMHINYYSILLEALPEIREAINEDRKLDGEVKQKYIEPLKSMLAAYVLKKKGIKPTIDNIQFSAGNIQFPTMPIIMPDESE